MGFESRRIIVYNSFMIKRIKGYLNRIFGQRQASKTLSKTELEKKVVQSARQVVKDYPGVFERLAKYDRV